MQWVQLAAVVGGVAVVLVALVLTFCYRLVKLTGRASDLRHFAEVIRAFGALLPFALAEVVRAVMAWRRGG